MVGARLGNDGVVGRETDGRGNCGEALDESLFRVAKKSWVANKFGDLSPQIVAYNGIEYHVIILAWYRGWRHDGNYNYHKTALDFYTWRNAIPDGWILRVRGTRFHTSEGIRATLGDEEQKVYWTEPDISLSFAQKYDVVLSREIDAPRDPDFDPLADLTAEFSGVPERHDETSFDFQVRFSEEVEIGYRQFLDSAFELTGGW